MKNRKGSLRFYFDDGDQEIPLSSEKPVWGERIVYSNWGDGSVEKTVVKFDTEIATEADWMRYQDALLEWERNQRVMTEIAHTKGVGAANRKRTQTATDYWKPYQDKYRQLRGSGMKKGKARHEVYLQIVSGKSWPPHYLKKRPDVGPYPSQKTLEKWLK